MDPKIPNELSSVDPDAETLREAAERAQENPMIRGKFINEEGNQTMFDKLVERIVLLEQQVAELTKDK